MPICMEYNGATASNHRGSMLPQEVTNRAGSWSHHFGAQKKDGFYLSSESTPTFWLLIFLLIISTSKNMSSEQLVSCWWKKSCAWNASNAVKHYIKGWRISPSKTMSWSIAPPSTDHEEHCIQIPCDYVNLHFTLFVCWDASKDLTWYDSLCEVFNLDVISGKCS